MKLSQKIVLILGGVGLLHSSMVPPVSQAAGSVCRYHEFTERSLFFTRTYGVNNSDMVALVSEYGVILAVVAITYMILGAVKK